MLPRGSIWSWWHLIGTVWMNGDKFINGTNLTENGGHTQMVG